ncbi:MAG: hypothetical protein SFT92_07420 [Rickettsiales bacterium]|nr:hypothetical protein [Rickettsiales bacterium]
MNFNAKYWVLGAVVAVILALLLAPTLMKERDISAQRAAMRKDKLVRKIEAYNKKNEDKYGEFGPAKSVRGGNQAVRPNNGQYRNQQQQSTGFNEQYYGIVPPSPDAATPNDGYYPPPPVIAPSNNGNRPAPPSSRMTTQGQEVAFDGMRVYAVGADGEPMNMPDGVYKLQSGTDLIVRDGKKIIINN